jgi:hypothetical protein
MTRQAWVNGVYVAAEEARISPFDRGFLFADDGDYPLKRKRELKFGTMPDRKSEEVRASRPTTASPKAMSIFRSPAAHTARAISSLRTSRSSPASPTPKAAP